MSRKQTRQQPDLERAKVAAPTPQAAASDTAAEAALAAAIKHHQAGELKRAAALYRKILEAQPGNAEVLNLLGMVMNRAGRNEAAVELFGKVVALKPELGEAHNNLGNSLRGLGRLDESVACFEKSIALKPSSAEAHYNLGISLILQGKFAAAVDACREASALKPDFADARGNLGIALMNLGKLDDAVVSYRKAIALAPAVAHLHYNLGDALIRQGTVDEAIASLQKAVALDPDFAGAHFALGMALKGQNRLEEAVAAYRTAIALKPGHAEAHTNLGVALKRQGKLEDAVAAYRTAIALKPAHAEAHHNLGIAFNEQGKHDEAVAACRTAIALEPDFAEAHSNLGVALQRQGEIEEAVASFREAIALKPDFAKAHSNLGGALVNQGKLDEAVASCQRAIALNPNFAEAHSNLLFNLHYIPGLTLEEIFAEHRRWNARHAAPLAGEIRPHTNVRDPDRRIRVGFVSGSFRRHPVGYMITPAVEARDGAAWELSIYSNGTPADDLTERIRAAADVWREIFGMNDDAVAQHIREDEIDILVDLSGHGERNRLLVFARKPAPVQVKWVGGQLNTTGMDAIDYFLTDVVETPRGAEKWFSEEVIRLPDGYACYDPPAYAPGVGPLPALSRGYVTFGCFNKLAKVNEGVVALWARLLHRLPGARLVLKTKSLGDAGVRERYHAMFEAHGVERERVDLLAPSPHAELLAHYNEIDIALDPFPYSGGLTTCEAMWTGVPVVTLPGDTFAGRHSASHLHNVGLGDWVVETPDDYLAVAERWSRDVAALADLRAGLRARMAASPLCDGVRFARNLEAAFRVMWRRWCEDPPTPLVPRDT